MSRPFAWALFAGLVVVLAGAVLTASAGEWARHGVAAGSFLLLGVWAAVALARGYSVRLNGMLVPPLGMAALAGLQLAAGVTVDRYATREAGVHWLALTAWVLVALQVFRFQRLRQLLLDGLVYTTVVLAVVSVLQVLTSEGRVFWLVPSGYTDDVLGPFVNRNHFAAFLVVVLGVALERALATPRRGWRFAVAAGVLFACITASASRAGFLLGLVVSAAFLVAGCRSADGRRQVARVLALGLLCTAAVGLKVWDRLREPAPEVGREQFLLSSVEMFRARPWTGFGLGTWPSVYPAYARFDPGPVVNHAHNDWAEWTAEGGLPALACMGLLAGLLLGAAWRGPWLAGVLALLVQATVDYPLQKHAIEVLVFLLAAAGAAERRAAREAVRVLPRLPDYSFVAGEVNASTVSRATSSN
jgi:O-antigen ligase